MVPQVQATEQARQERGRRIVESADAIRRIDEHSYKVQSQSGNGFYDVISTELGWSCSCLDYVNRGSKCKHIWGVLLSLEIREKVAREAVIIREQNTLACTGCGSGEIVKKAVRHNKCGDIQRYLCKGCGKRFSFNIGFEKMKHSPQGITTAIQLYFSGESSGRPRSPLSFSA